MYDLTAADINSHVADAAAITVEDQIAGLQAVCTDRSTVSGLGSGIMGQGNTEIGKYSHSKAGAVCSVRQAGSSPYIGISYKLAGLICNCLSGGAGGSIFRIGIIGGRILRGGVAGGRIL